MGVAVWVAMMSPWEAGYPIVDMRSIRLEGVSAPVRISEIELSIAEVSTMKLPKRVIGLVACFDNV